MTTNVPMPVFGPAGFIAPLESAILAGVQADQQAAFGGNLNPALTNPTGQLAQSQAAVVGDCFDQFVALTNGVDPAFATGRMQDAIARIYFITRNPAQATVAIVTCSGLTGTVIPLNAQVVDQAGNIYLCTESGTIPAGGSVDLSFAGAVTGPIACPIGYITSIYQAIPGWDSVTNAAAGVLGNVVESAADFELRRQRSVAANAQGSIGAVLGSVLSVPGVLDAYAFENTSSVSTGAYFTGYIVGNVLTVTAIASGSIALGQMLSATGISIGTEVAAFGSGSGGLGTYTVSISQTFASLASPLPLVSSTGGFAIGANSILVCAAGGDPQAIANAIWLKKSPGCNTSGNVTMTVQDTLNYVPPYPTYSISFQQATSASIKFLISMQMNPGVPSNAVSLIAAAVLSAFNGTDGGTKARIGGAIFASRFYGGIVSLGAWAQIYSIQLGVGIANQNSVLMPINLAPTLSTSDISISFS